MHRRINTLRWGLGISLTLLLFCAVHLTHGQDPRLVPLQDPPALLELPPPATTFIVVPVNSTKRIEASTKEILKDVRNENPKIARVQSIPDDPRAVLVTGLEKGSTRLTLTDINRKSETIEIRVPDEDLVKLEERRQQLMKLLHDTVPTALVEATVTNPNTVILTGTAPNTETVQVILETARSVFGGANAVVINGMRIGGVQHVQVEVIVAIVNRSKLRVMSTNWGLFNDKWFLTSVIGTGGGSALASTASLSNLFNPPTAPSFGNAGALTSALASTPNIDFGVFGHRSSFLGFLEAMRTEGLAKIMVEPRVTTLSGRPSYIVSGGETPILTGGGTSGPTVSFKQYGTVVNFLPIVLGNGKIHLEVRPELSNINAASGITISSGLTPTVIPGFSTRSAQVAVQIEDGQTLAIGGLIQNTVNATISKVPFFGDLPYVNIFFSSKSFNETEEELLILVTPRLVDPVDCGKIPQYLPGRETRSPDNFELFLQGILEAPRGPRTSTLNPLKYKGAHMGSLNAAQYPCANGTVGCSTCNQNLGSSTNVVIDSSVKSVPYVAKPTTFAPATVQPPMREGENEAKTRTEPASRGPLTTPPPSANLAPPVESIQEPAQESPTNNQNPPPSAATPSQEIINRPSLPSLSAPIPRE